jgi:hypothetical protein
LVALSAYCPLGQATHLEPAIATTVVPVPSATTEPSSHASHDDACVPEYVPASQSSHAAVDAAEYWPLAQAVHLVPPADPSVLVIDPALHSAHAVDSASLYQPASHALHAKAASSLAPRFVPASHPLQKLPATSSWNFPAGHCRQSTVLLAPSWSAYVPLSQQMQLEAPWPG